MSFETDEFDVADVEHAYAYIDPEVFAPAEYADLDAAPCESVDAEPVGLLFEIPDFRLPNSVEFTGARETLDAIIHRSDATEHQIGSLFEIYGVDGVSKTQSQLAREYGVSREAVNQIESRGLKRLRQAADGIAIETTEQGEAASYEFYKEHLEKYHNWAGFLATIKPQYHHLYEKAAEVFDMRSRDKLRGAETKVLPPPDVSDPLVMHWLTRAAGDMEDSITAEGIVEHPTLLPLIIAGHRDMYIAERTEALYLARRGATDELPLRQSLEQEFGVTETLYRTYESQLLGLNANTGRNIANPRTREVVRKAVTLKMRTPSGGV